MLNRSKSLRKPAADPRTAAPSMGPPTSDPDPRTLSPSRLPVKPGPRTAATTSGGSAMGPPTSAVSRQTSGARLASTALRRATSVRTKEADGSSDQAKRETARYPPSSSRTASAAMHPPAGGVTGRTRSRTTTSMGSATGSTHTRTRSTTTTLPSSTAMRPTSQQAASSTSPATATAAPTKRPRPLSHHPSSTSTTSTSTSTSRALPSHRRAASTSSRTLTSTTPAASTHPSSSSSQSQAQPSQQQHAQLNRLKPAFTTLQQHYSPAKSSAPKPLTSTFLAPPSPSKLPTNIAISADTLRLQNELLRLHTLHAAQPSTTSSYLASAQAKLSVRFVELAASHGELSSREADAQQRLNTAALRRWCEARSSGGGTATGDLGGEKLRVLDGVLSGLWALSEPGGKYARVVRRFERWAERAAEIEHARRGKGGGGSSVLLLEGDEPALVGELDAQWQDECALLSRRLEAWRHDLAHVGDVPPPPGDGRRGESGSVHASSLERILAGCGALVGGMLEELELMAGIEREAVVKEREWIRGMIDGVGVDDEAAPRAGAIWRAL